MVTDKYFKVTLDLDGSSPNPAKSIYAAQHRCVVDDDYSNFVFPEQPTDTIIAKQLKVKHWSVLEFATAILHIENFPHDTIMQLVRHHSAKPLITSLRYTGKQFTDIDYKSSEEDIDKLFYYSVEGDYFTRGGKFNITPEARTRFYAKVRLACVDYKLDLDSNLPEEVARRGLPSGYRQSMVMSGTARTWFHILDLRLLKDSQPECQEAARLILEELSIWYPELFKWYTTNRAGKNLLSP